VSSSVRVQMETAAPLLAARRQTSERVSSGSRSGS
jgi:hypothetical protein